MRKKDGIFLKHLKDLILKTKLRFTVISDFSNVRILTQNVLFNTRTLCWCFFRSPKFRTWPLNIVLVALLLIHTSLLCFSKNPSKICCSDIFFHDVSHVQDTISTHCPIPFHSYINRKTGKTVVKAKVNK